MKALLMIMTLAVSVPTFAKTKVEFDETQEMACFAEAKKLGCVSNDSENSTCTEKNKSKLSAECKRMHELKK